MLWVGLDLVVVMVTLFFFAFGGTMASFLMLVADRLPRQESIVYPPSHCDSCGVAIRWYGLIPVLGWFLVRGKCTACGAKFSVLYPLAELLLGFATVFICFYYASPEEYFLAVQNALSANSGQLLGFGHLRYERVVLVLTALFLLFTGFPLAIIDVRHRILPNLVTYPGCVLGLLLGTANTQLGFVGSLMGAVVGGGGLLLVAKVYSALRSREGMGMGDVKYLVMLGTVLGWQGALFCVALASLLGALWGLATGLVRREGLQASLPFGPFLAFSALIVHVFADKIHHYLFYAG